MRYKFAAFLVVGCIAGSFAGPVQADSVDADSAINQAIVYPSSARVTRTAKVELKPGLQTVRLKGVQAFFDENSLSVSANGTAQVKILGARIKKEFLQQPSDERVRDLQARIQAVDDAMALLNAETAVFVEKRAFLNSVRLFTAGQLPKDMATKVPSADELKATLAFLEEGTKGYEEGQLAIGIKQREKNLERQALQQELNQLMSSSRNEQRILTVDLECEKAGNLTIEAAYTLNAVGWYPVYDARVEFEKAKANLSAFAVVRQTTGEDWTDVQLTLSTSMPSVGGRMPELNQWYLRPRQIEHKKSAVAYGLATRSKSANLMEMASDSVMEDSFQPMMAPPQAAEMAYAKADVSGVSLTYKAPRAVTVKSDGSEVRVPLNVQTLDAVLEYAATPKLSSYAYLKSLVTNSPEEQLMAGRVNVFLDGTYVGNSDIQKTIPPGAKFDLYMGVDEGVTVKRELIEQKSDDTLIGNIPSPTKKITYTYKITVESFKPKAVTVKLFDQIPVAQDDKIRVVKVTPGLKPDTDRYQDREGVYLWTLLVQPKEKKEITLSYVIEYPRDMNIEGL